MNNIFLRTPIAVLVQLLMAGTIIGFASLAHAGTSVFSVSVDGNHVAGTAGFEKNAITAADTVDIQMSYDALEIKRVLKVANSIKGGLVEFKIESNYAPWIARSEIVIFDKLTRKTVATRVASSDGRATWEIPTTQLAEDYSFYGRVYDELGNFDATVKLALGTSRELTAALYARRDIVVEGGSVTVIGTSVPSNHNVLVAGVPIAVAPEGTFQQRVVLPVGESRVEVAIVDRTTLAKGSTFSQTVNVPSQDWFFTGLADLVVGRKIGGGNVEAVRGDEYDKTYAKGRLAFYLKGKIKGQYILTASADLRGDNVKSLFGKLSANDPRQLLRDIDPNAYYPVYGDSSTALSDAPTRGRFYVRLERGESRVIWGTFKTGNPFTEYAANDRILYGAQGVYQAETSTTFGEPTSKVTTYAAQPETLQQRDELRGTGGSAYFLKHQSILNGSEIVLIEVRDSFNGRVVEKKTLQSDKDYSFNALQGVVILTRPLPSSRVDGYENYLVVGYDYKPTSQDVSALTYGGRAQQWLGDNLSVGVTVASEKSEVARQELAGVDLHLRASERTSFDIELAKYKGPGFGIATSADGGMTISNPVLGAGPAKGANALRLKAKVDLGDLGETDAKGDLELYYDAQQAGFATPRIKSDVAKKVWGGTFNYESPNGLRTKLSGDGLVEKGRRTARKAKAFLGFDLSEHWSVDGGFNYVGRTDSGLLGMGERADFEGIITYRPLDKLSFNVAAQATLKRTGTVREDDRIGFGATYAYSDNATIAGDISTGSGGLGLLLSWSNEDLHGNIMYLNYVLEHSNFDDFHTMSTTSDFGTIIAGTRQVMSEQFSVFAEERSALGVDRKDVSQAYGFHFNPSEFWLLTGNVENGLIWDDSINAATGIENNDFNRTAASLAATYTLNDRTHLQGKAEFRSESPDDDRRNRDSFLFGSNVTLGFAEDWQFVADFDAVLSDAAGDAQDGQYIEGSLGFAYRPVKSDRLNALFKYTYLCDLPGADQVTVDGTTMGPSQLSHILSADVMYDLNDWLSVGGKYGLRYGAFRDRTNASTWETELAQLGVLRLDVQVTENWEALLEGRMLWASEGGKDTGVLSGVYRKMGGNFKIGVGYNFGRFSDDLRDMVADDHGVFINAIGKF
jgi:hypothetical protein